MKNTKRIAACGILSALSITLIYITTVTDIFSLCGCYAAALCVLFVKIEYGTSSALTVYAVTAVLSWLILPDKFIAAVYTFVVGIYPVVKVYFDSIKPRMLAYACKLAALDVILAALYVTARAIFAVEADTTWMIILTAALADVSFILADILTDRLTLIYTIKYRAILHRRGIL